MIRPYILITGDIIHPETSVVMYPVGSVIGMEVALQMAERTGLDWVDGRVIFAETRADATRAAYDSLDQFPVPGA